jgi:hypothetical protein
VQQCDSGAINCTEGKIAALCSAGGQALNVAKAQDMMQEHTLLQNILVHELPD